MRLVVVLCLSLFISQSWALETVGGGGNNNQTTISSTSVNYPRIVDNAYNVFDKINILSRHEVEKLNKLCFHLQEDKKINLKLLTIPSLKQMNAAGMPFESYAQSAYRHWNISAPGTERRVLVLYSKAENKVAINSDKNWEDSNSSAINTLITKYYNPYLKKGNVRKALYHGMNKTIDYLATGELPSLWHSIFFWVKWLIVLGIIGWLIKERKTNPILQKLYHLLQKFKR